MLIRDAEYANTGLVYATKGASVNAAGERLSYNFQSDRWTFTRPGSADPAVSWSPRGGSVSWAYSDADEAVVAVVQLLATK